jgi:hypothetical protein
MVLRVDGCFTRSSATIVWDEEAKHYVMHETDAEERKEQQRIGDWMFIFIDIIYLGMMIKCSGIVENCAISWHTIMFCVTMLTTLYITRMHLDDYVNRFYENDVFHRLLFFIYILCFMVMTLNVNSIETNGEPSDAACMADLYGIAFGLAFFATRVVLLMLQLSVVFTDASFQALRQFGPAIISFAMSAFVVFVVVLVEYKDPEDVPPRHRMYTYMAACSIEMVAHAWYHCSLAFGTYLHKIEASCPDGCHIVGREVYPLDTDISADRLGAFMMCIFGVVLITNLTRYYNVGHAAETYPYSIGSMILSFYFALIYYEVSKVGEGDHALTKSTLSQFLYVWMHLLAAMSSFFTNAAIGAMYEQDVPQPTYVYTEIEQEADDEAIKETEAHKPIFRPDELLSCSLGFTLIWLGILSILHKGLGQFWKKGGSHARAAFIVKVVASFFHFIIPALPIAKGSLIVWTHVMLLTFAVIAESRYGADPEKDKEEEAAGISEDEEGKEEEEPVQEANVVRQEPTPFNEPRQEVRSSYSPRTIEDRESMSAHLGIEKNSRAINEGVPVVRDVDVSLESLDRRAHHRRASVKASASAASPKDAHLMMVASPRVNPLERRRPTLSTTGNLEQLDIDEPVAMQRGGGVDAAAYHESSEKRKARINALSGHAQKMNVKFHNQHVSNSVGTPSPLHRKSGGGSMYGL